MKSCEQVSKTVDGVEVFPIEGYEGLYSISKCGRVWSWPRETTDRLGRPNPVAGRWRKFTKNMNGYLYLPLSKDGKTRMHRLHRILAETFLGAVGLEVDHRNGNKLDNRLRNLRVATKQQNTWNTGARKGSRSKFKGVGFKEDSSRWRAYLTVDGVYKHLGHFDSEEDAAAAYDAAAREIQGEFFRPNLPD